MKKLILYSLILVAPVLLTTACLTDQMADFRNDNTFIKIYIDRFFDEPHTVLELEDGFLCVATSSIGLEDRVFKIKLLKTNSRGEQLWSTVFPEDDQDGNFRAAGLLVHQDRIIIMADSLANNNSLFLIQFNREGDLVSKKMLASAVDTSYQAKSINFTEDNTILIGADVRSNTNEASVRIAEYQNNDNFDLIWTRNYGANYDLQLTREIYKKEGEIYFFANDIRSNENASIMAFNAQPNGQLQGRRIGIVSGNDARARHFLINEAAEGLELILVGEVKTQYDATTSNMLFSRLSPTYEILGNERSIGNGTEVYRAASIAMAHDNNYVLLGSVAEEGAVNNDISLIKLDTRGNEIWSRSFGSPTTNELSSHVIPTSDGGYAILGSTAFSERSMTLIKVNDKGRLNQE